LRFWLEAERRILYLQHSFQRECSPNQTIPRLQRLREASTVGICNVMISSEPSMYYCIGPKYGDIFRLFTPWRSLDALEEVDVYEAPGSVRIILMIISYHQSRALCFNYSYIPSIYFIYFIFFSLSFAGAQLHPG
jgi:hypothetical protein